MIRCYHCGTDNLDDAEYCDECGKKLNAPAAQSNYVPPPPAQFITQVAPPPPSFTRDSVTPKPATPYTPPPPPVHPPIERAVDKAGDKVADRVFDRVANQAISLPADEQASPPMDRAAERVANIPPPPNVSGVPANSPPGSVQSPSRTATFNGQTNQLRGGAVNAAESGRQQAMGNEDSSAMPVSRAKLIIQRGGKIGKEFPITGVESMIGRWDADGGIFPDIDLDQDDPEAKVSRRHARIHFLSNQYLIEDLGSTNGTFINRGPRLLPGARQPLNNGDEIIVGKTFLKFVLS